MSSRAGIAFAGLGAGLCVALTTRRVLDFDWAAVDDHGLVLLQSTVNAPASAGWLRMLTTPGMGHPMPVTNATLALDYALWGVDPAGWHGTALGWLVLSAMVLPWMIAALGRQVGIEVPALAAFVGALAAMMHPATAEVAGWVVARKDLCAGLFALVGVGALAQAAPGGHPRWLAAATLAVALAIGSKSSAVALPLLFGLAALRSRGPSGFRMVVCGGSLAILGVVAAGLARTSQARLGLLGNVGGVGEWLRGIGAGARAQLWLVARPRPTLPFANPDVGSAAGSFSAAFGLALVLLLVGLIVVLVARARAQRRLTPIELMLALGACAWLPVSGLLGRPQMASADRYLYLALLLCLGPSVAFGLTWLGQRGRTYAIAAAAFVALPLVAGAALQRDIALDAWERPTVLGKRMMHAWSREPGSLAHYWSCDLLGMAIVIPHHNQVPGLGDSTPKQARQALVHAAAVWAPCARAPERDPSAAAGRERLLDLVARARTLSRPYVSDVPRDEAPPAQKPPRVGPPPSAPAPREPPPN